MELNIDVILEDLKDGKVPRTQQNLDKLNSILEEYAKAGQKDFSITQIGRVSAAESGPGYEALRATRNVHYRTLIEAWARNRYRKEVNLLKQHANITIDKRPVRQFDASAESSIEVLPSLSGVLTESEKKALAYAISDECMEKNGWQCTQAGQVKEMEYNNEVLPRGFVTGLRKLLGEVDD